MASDLRFSQPWGLLWTLLFLPLLCWGQQGDRDQLEAEREAISARIAATQSLLKATRDDKAKSTQEWAVLKEQLSLRQQLLSNLRAERRAAERRLAQRETGVQSADGQLAELKEEYAEMIRIADRIGGQDQWWQVVLDAEGTTQAFRRLMLIGEYRRQRHEQAARIEASAQALRTEMSALERERNDLVDVEADLRAERDAARSAARRMESLVSDFQSREQELRNQLAKEEARRAELGKAIARILEAARREADNTTGFAATPEGQIIAAEFKANRGRLPWPVAEGVLVGRFGTHPHPSLPGIQIERRGIDIATSGGSKVYAIFSGRVSNVISIPGGGLVVMVDHGSHRSVYANLGTVTVEAGDDLQTGQPVGTVIDLGDGPRAHLEIWDAKGSSPLDPAQWIAR